MPQLQQRALSLLTAVRTRETGQTMAEYGLILAVISAGVILALLAFSGAVHSGLEKVNDTIGDIL